MRKIQGELSTLFNSYKITFINTFKWKSNLNSDEIDYIENKKVDLNLHKIVLYSILVFFFQICNLIIDSLIKTHPGYQSQYLTAVIFLAVICIIYFVITLYFLLYNKFNIIMKKLLYKSFWFIISSGILIFCILDLLETGSLNNFIILLVATAIIAVLDIKEISFILLFDLIVQVTAIIVLKKEVYLILHSTILVIASTVLGQMLFSAFLSSNIAQKRLQQFAETDALTGLPNRRGLEEWIIKNKAACIKENCRISIGFIDIDYFKSYNDKFGHVYGDECIKTIANCLNMFFNGKTSIVCRYGGDEFVVVLKNITDDDALELFTNTKTLLENEKVLTTHNVVTQCTTVSIGVAFEKFDEHSNFCDILHRADKALYKAKNRGRNIVVLDKEKCVN